MVVASLCLADMPRFPPLLWLFFLLILLLPSAAGRLLLDLAGGLMIFLFALPFALAGLGWVGWKILQSRMKVCQNCGTSTLTDSPTCPACGSLMNQGNGLNQSRSESDFSSPASSATIDVSAEDVE